MSSTVGDHLVERLATGGVRRIYGYPGDGINGIMGALGRAGRCNRRSGPLEFVQVRHEEMAALMACARRARAQGAPAVLTARWCRC